MEHQDPYHKAQLLLRYLRHEATPAEQQTVEDWLNESEENRAFFNQLQSEQGLTEETKFFAQTDKEQAWKQLQQTIRPKTRTLWPRIAAAASILLVLSMGGYFLLKKQSVQQLAQNQKNDIAPGGNMAILTLSNGQKIMLNGKQGKIATQAGKAVTIGASGGVSYTGIANSSEPIYNTLTVPIGNRSDLILPDGSEVSLDAGSSITYPVVFEKERRISMTGQAYIKVRHDAAHPFYTSVKGVTIRDIGTEFNINAYDDEPGVKTTLIDGSVKVNDLILKPGEQAATEDNRTIVKAADLRSVTAWKDNDFFFRNQSLKTSMRQIARWYNVNVVYHNADEKLQLFVDVSRSINLSVVLKAIENTGKVKCSLVGRTITLSQPN